MADATRVSGNVAGTPVKQGRWAVAADNDVLFTADSKMLIIGAIFHNVNVTALNVDGGVDITEYPYQLDDGEALQATATGAGQVTVFYIDEPDEGYPTFTA